MYTELEPDRKESTFVDNIRFGAKLRKVGDTRLATWPPLRRTTKVIIVDSKFSLDEAYVFCIYICKKRQDN